MFATVQSVYEVNAINLACSQGVGDYHFLLETKHCTGYVMCCSSVIWLTRFVEYSWPSGFVLFSQHNLLSLENKRLIVMDVFF